MAIETVQSTITPEAVEAALVEFDEHERALLVTGRERTLMTFQTTGLLASELLPREWEAVSAFLYALLEREPTKSSPSRSAHRILLGSFAGELRGFARQTGEPVGLEADLRAAATQADERRIRGQIVEQQRALARHLDDVAMQQAAQHTVSAPVSDPEPHEEDMADDASPAPNRAPDDDAWLL